MGLLEDMIAAHDVQWRDLDALGVGVGPGNFTGIRIAISAARGLGLGLGIPVVGVSQFDTTRRLSGQAQTAVPAPRDHVYFHDATTALPPVLIPTGKVTTAASATNHDTENHVRTIATIAAERAQADTPAPKPLYIKPPDAAPARDAPPRMLP